MRYSIAALALAGAAYASPAPVATATGAASTCSGDYSGNFEIQIVNVTSSGKREALEKRAALVLTLSGGILKDAEGRIGYIASNNQFQFDYEAQPGSIYDAGWAVCSNNNTLVLGSDAVFQKCLSGTFYNLYDENSAAQCSPVYIDVVSTGGAPAAQLGDGQVTASPVASQISDGQIQGPTGAVSPVQQISDGQIQATTAPAPSSAVSPVQQISDGQIQATAAPAPSSAVSPVQQISDGQIQATGAGYAPTNTSTPRYPTASATVQPYTGAASHVGMASSLVLLAGLIFAL